MARVLGRIRLSRLTDESTSEERQRKSIQGWADIHGHTIVGWAVDIDVSRSVDPFNAPDLKNWLNLPEKIDAWDYIVQWKLDRLATGSIYLNKVMGFCQEKGKVIVSVTENFDLSTWVGRMIANVIAGVAEGEWEAISERNTNAFEHNITAGKYRGGNPPFGYRPKKVDGEWRYVQDPEMAALARNIIARLLDGERITTIVRDLNTRNVRTPQDHFLVSQGRKPKGSKWAVSNLARELQSPTLLGQVVRREAITGENGQPLRKNGRKVYGPKQVVFKDGKPLVRAEPIITEAEFQRLQKALDSRKGTPRSGQQASNALLLQVLFCGICGRPMYQQKGRTFFYYRCAAANYQESCGNTMVRNTVVDEFATDQLMELMGDLPHVIPVYDPGEDTTKEIAEIDAKLASLAASVTRFPEESAALEALLKEVDALTARRSELAARPYRPAGYRYRSTGQTFRQYWAGLDQQGRNQYLRNHKVRLEYSKRRDGAPTLNIEMLQVDSMVRAVNAQKAELLSEGMTFTELAETINDGNPTAV